MSRVEEKVGVGKDIVLFRGIVRVWKVMRREGLLCNPSGSRPNFFGRQHLTFNKGGKNVVLSVG